MDISLILHTRFPGTKWTLSGDEFSGLEWFDESPKPTENELVGLWESVKYEFEYRQIESVRGEQYKLISDPLFFKWQAGTATKEEWLAARESIQTANPYPEVGA